MSQPDCQPRPGEKKDGDGGHWYMQFCTFGSFKTWPQFEKVINTWDAMSMGRANQLRQAGLRWGFFATPPPARPTAQSVMASVSASLPFPQSYVAVNPTARRQVVGVPTWVWLTDAAGQPDPDRYRAQSKTLALFGYQLRWQMEPVLSIDDGTDAPPTTCTGAGRPWSAGADPGTACTMTYDHSGHYQLSADVAWTVHWWLAGQAQPDIIGPHRTAQTNVDVNEIQSVVQPAS